MENDFAYDKENIDLKKTKNSLEIPELFISAKSEWKTFKISKLASIYSLKI